MALAIFVTTFDFEHLIIHYFHTLITEESCHPILGNRRSQDHDENSKEDRRALNYTPLEVSVIHAHGCLHEGKQKKDD